MRITIATLLCAWALTSCSASVQGVAAPKPQFPFPHFATSLDTISYHGYRYVLLLPPERAYAADRLYMMGGPVAGDPTEAGQSVTSVNLSDPTQSLSHWQIWAWYRTQAECEADRSSGLEDVADPAWIARQARLSPTHLMIDPARIRDRIAATRCISIAELKLEK